MTLNIELLHDDDRGYALEATMEAHKNSPGCDRAPWWVYKIKYGAMLKTVFNADTTVALGAYEDNRLLGFLVMTPGKRVATCHWCQVKGRIDGTRVLDRRGIMFALLKAADLGPRFIYTLRGPRCSKSKYGVRSLDELLAAELRARGQAATYVELKEWIK